MLCFRTNVSIRCIESNSTPKLFIYSEGCYFMITVKKVSPANLCGCINLPLITNSE